MNEFKGTKCEWIINPKNRKLVETRKGVDIANCSNSVLISSDEKDANANLIATAPELLDASIQALRFMQKIGINYDNADIYNKLNIAINKALGK